MSKISLRAYNREIETLIERGHTEEAIAHCKYILKTYSKHLDTYRLLGKAFLESQRYGEAADILNRILSVIPDDFVAQIGMSIIREDEGNLDAAIFHMERSFEIQPSNAAIQDELRRLYGRRDGIEPPKLRLTRGALVRMYARGDLYRQAIAEARAAIKEDPQRLDLEIVLALMYYQTGQKAEAAEICSRLVMKLPFCMEANRILADVLPETSRSDDAKIYQQRLVALEPYLGYQSDPSQSVLQIPDNAVTLDRLEWIPSLESSQQPSWANTLGLQIEEKEEAQMPEWISGLSTEQVETFGEEDTLQPFIQEQETSETPLTSSIPETSDVSHQGPEDQISESTEALPESQAKTTADLTEWMQDNGETPAVSEEEKLPDWMQGIGETPSGSEEEKLPEWMQTSGWKISENPAEIPNEEPTPSAIFEEVEESEAAPAELPDWLTDLAPTPELENVAEVPSSSIEIPAAEDIVQPSSEAKSDEELPEWLKSTSSSPEENINAQNQEPLPDWLTESHENVENLAEAPASIENALETGQTINETQPSSVQPDNEVIAGSAITSVSSISAETIPSISPDLENMDDAMAWLESLAAKQGADEETLFTKPEERIETPPGWVSQATAPIATPGAHLEVESFTSETIEPHAVPEEPVFQPVPSTAELISPFQSEEQMTVSEEPITAEENVLSEPAAEVKPVVSEETEQADVTSALAWLESLAAKQGAEPETLFVSSEERLETPPDWIRQESTETGVEIEQETVEPSAKIEEESSGQLPDWMVSTEPVESPVAELPANEVSLPDWLKEDSTPSDMVEDITLPVIADIPVTTEEAKIPLESPANFENETVWVKETDLFETKPEEPVTQPEVEPTVEVKEEAPEIETYPASVGPEPLPDWLTSDLSTSSAALEEKPEQERETTALPDWLQAETPLVENIPGDSSLLTSEVETPPLPDWLKNLEAEQEEEPLPVEGGFNVAPAKQQSTGEISESPDEMIPQAQNALGKGQIEFALSVYQRLIEKDQKLDETIHDLRDALYRFPVDSVIWQTLGDAYMRNNQVQAALDAFTKAEELLK